MSNYDTTDMIIEYHTCKFRKYVISGTYTICPGSNDLEPANFNEIKPLTIRFHLEHMQRGSHTQSVSKLKLNSAGYPAH